MREVESIKENDVATYKEAVSLLETEASEDDQARIKFGTDRWIRPIGQQAAEKLYKQVTEIDGYLKSADSSDKLVKAKLKDWEGVIKVLEGTDRDLENFVPSSKRPSIPEPLKRETSKLRAILNEIDRMETRRRRQIEDIREKAQEDDISRSLRYQRRIR